MLFKKTISIMLLLFIFPFFNFEKAAPAASSDIKNIGERIKAAEVRGFDISNDGICVDIKKAGEGYRTKVIKTDIY